MGSEGVDWRVGTIGFAYDDWKGVFYPPDLRVQDRLHYYATRFRAIELDTTFYALPPPERVQRWADQVPPEFRFSLKAPRDLSHDDRPGWFARPTARDLFREFLDRARLLGDRLGVVLLQLSPNLSAGELGALEKLLTYREGTPVAVEFRHRSWAQDATFAMLNAHGVSWVAADLAPAGHASRSPEDLPGYHPLPFLDTAPLLYLRLCGQHAQYETDDHELLDATPRIQWWLEQLSTALNFERQAFAFCGNSFAGHGPATCARLQSLVGDSPMSGMQPSLFSY